MRSLESMIAAFPDTAAWTWELCSGVGGFKAQCAATDTDTQAHIAELMLEALRVFPGLTMVRFKGFGPVRFRTIWARFNRDKGWLDRFGQWVELQEWPPRQVAAVRTATALAKVIEAITPYLPGIVAPGDETPVYQEQIDDATRRELQAKADLVREILTVIRSAAMNDAGRLRATLDCIDRTLGDGTTAYNAISGDILALVWQYCEEVKAIAIKQLEVQP